MDLSHLKHYSKNTCNLYKTMNNSHCIITNIKKGLALHYLSSILNVN